MPAVAERNVEKSAETDSLAGVSSSQAERPVIYSSYELLAGKREAWIEHGNEMYRLRLTHAGKLYLTK